MGLFDLLTEKILKLWLGTLVGQIAVVSFTIAILMVLVIALNLLSQALARNPHEPPIIPYLIPWVGSALSYGEDPYVFFFKCRQKYGDVFTFVLLGKKMTVCLGTKGNDFILNGKLQDVNAEEIYTGLTTPVFGSGVVYDCPNATLMEQKRFLKFGLTTEALHSHVPLFTGEFYAFLENSSSFRGSKGVFDVVSVMAEITIYTASRSLQGREVRKKFDSTFADLYHDLDMGFTPVNFVLPWLPLPTNRRRDRAQRKLAQTYIEIIQARRRNEGSTQDTEKDMIWNLMSARYKSGASIPDREIAHMMIALLMAGQHSSSSIGSWIMLRLASRPDIMEQLYEEQVRVLGPNHRQAPTYEDIRRLTLNAFVVKETLRLHAPIHSIMRAVKTPLTIETVDTNLQHGERKSYTIPTSHILLSAPGVTANSSKYFAKPSTWDPHRWEGEVQEKHKDEKIDYGYGLVSKGAGSPYLPFGAGRHRCIGEQFAYLQLGCITALMVREFKFRNVEGGCDMVKTNYTSLFSRPVDPAFIEWERRDPDTGKYSNR